MTHDLLDYPQKMRGSGYRVTPQRKVILDAICEAGHRATIEEIIVRVRKKSLTLNRATIYRNLDFLQRMHLVNATGTGKARKYEIASLEPHHHLICRKCGMETGLDHKLVDRMSSMIRKGHHFVIDNDHLSFQGLCSQCSSGRNRKFKRATENSK